MVILAYFAAYEVIKTFIGQYVTLLTESVPAMLSTFITFNHNILISVEPYLEGKQ